MGLLSLILGMFGLFAGFAVYSSSGQEDPDPRLATIGNLTKVNFQCPEKRLETENVQMVGLNPPLSGVKFKGTNVSVFFQNAGTAYRYNEGLECIALLASILRKEPVDLLFGEYLPPDTGENSVASTGYVRQLGRYVIFFHILLIESRTKGYKIEDVLNPIVVHELLGHYGLAYSKQEYGPYVLEYNYQCLILGRQDDMEGCLKSKRLNPAVQDILSTEIAPQTLKIPVLDEKILKVLQLIVEKGYPLTKK